MATLTIRNLPDEVYALLKERAKRNRRSLNQEVITELARQSSPSEDERVTAARERWKQANSQVHELRTRMTGFMNPEEIRAAIEEGRR